MERLNGELNGELNGGTLLAHAPTRELTHVWVRVELDIHSNLTMYLIIHPLANSSPSASCSQSAHRLDELDELRS